MLCPSPIFYNPFFLLITILYLKSRNKSKRMILPI